MFKIRQDDAGQLCLVLVNEKGEEIPFNHDNLLKAIKVRSARNGKVSTLHDLLIKY
jgi:hypothetical protein